MGHRPRGGDEIGEQHALIGGGPFLVDANVAWTILHGGNTMSGNNITVDDVAQASPTANDARGARCEFLSRRQGGDQGMIRSARHRLLAPSFLGALGRCLEAVIERRMISPDAFKQVGNVRAHALQWLYWYRSEE